MKTLKKTAAFALAVLLLLSAIPTALVSAYDVGSIVQYGNYPQSRVTDEVRIDQFVALEEQAKADKKPWNWKSFGYSNGTGERYDGNMQSDNYMTYHDFTLGTETYRAVRISAYRPYYVGYSAGNDKLKTYQDDHGYNPDATYYFHFEPLKWRVLNPNTGLIICESIIDAQPYQSVVYESEGTYYTSTDKKELANDYQHTSIHKWIIRDFFDTAFTRAEQMSIPTTLITFNDGSTASERVFLASVADVSNSAYGFSAADVNDSARKVAGTDYAKCQGLVKSTDSRNGDIAPWWLRDSASSSGKALCVSYDGKVQNESATVDLNYIGIRPACYVNNLVSESELCPFCGKQHGNSFFQRIIAFFHSIFAFIRRTDINMG